MGTVLGLLGELNAAMPFLEKSAQLSPASGEAYGKLGLALAENGRIREAIACYRESLRLRPNQVPARNNLAWLLATQPDPGLRNGAEAVTHAEYACEVTGYKQAMLVGTLAAAYAESGDFQHAVRAGEQAIDLATKAGQAALVAKNQELLALYRAGKAYREPAK
jgi:Flp pilus assembly protein TadD